MAVFRFDILIGLATTGQLLAELESRGANERVYRNHADELVIGTRHLMNTLPATMLEHRRPLTPGSNLIGWPAP